MSDLDLRGVTHCGSIGAPSKDPNLWKGNEKLSPTTNKFVGYTNKKVNKFSRLRRMSQNFDGFNIFWCGN